MKRTTEPLAGVQGLPFSSFCVATRRGPASGRPAPLHPELRLKRREGRARVTPSTVPPRRTGAGHALGTLLDPREPFLIPLLLLIAARTIAWLAIPVASEDAYITFRYARNAAAGLGLVFNPGEHVMGFTSPLWVVWNVAGAFLLHDPVFWSRATVMVTDAIALAAAVVLLRRHASNTAAWIFGVFFAAWPFCAAVAMSGMENSVMLALILTAAWAIDSRRGLAGPLLAGLALTRPEGLVVAAIMAVRARPRARVIAAAIVVPALLLLTVYYGSPLPQSVIAKSTLYGTPGPWLGRHWWEWVLPMALGRWPVTGEGSMMLPLAVLVAPGLVFGLVRLWRARHSGLALAALGMLVVWAGYALLGVAYFYWYMIVPLAGVVLVAAVGLPDLLRGRAVLISCALFVLGSWSVARVLYVGRAQNELNSFGGVATFLEGAAQPGQKVMLEPIGMIGYRAPLVVVDEVGLVSPEVARRRRGGPGWYADIAVRERPDWLVVRPAVFQSNEAFAGRGAPFRSGAERDSLLAHYARAYTPPAGRGDLAVWRRVR